MTFLQIFRWSHYVLIVLGIFSLCIAKFLNFAVLLLPFIAIAVAENESTKDWADKLPNSVINGVSLFFFFYHFFVHFLMQEDIIAAVIYFTIYLQIIKIFTARKNRDYFQMFALSMTHLISSTLLTTDVLFIVPFLCFIILAPWASTVYNLKVQLELAYMGPEKDRDNTPKNPGYKRTMDALNSRRIVSSRFFLITASLSLILLLNTMAVFFIFPRVSFGFLFRKAQAQRNVSGFSENVDLSTLGTIKTSDGVVMRVEMVDADPAVVKRQLEGFYWRGLAYDSYNGKTWQRTMSNKNRLPIDVDTNSIAISDTLSEDRLSYRVFLEPLDTRVLFAIDRVEKISWDKMKLETVLRRVGNRSDRSFSIARDYYSALYFSTNLAKDRVYTAYSNPKQISPTDLRVDIDKNQYPTWVRDLYFQLPTFSDRFHQLAEQIASSFDNDYDRVIAVRQYFAENFDYTLRVKSHGESPIEGFLFKDKAGHCEFFASSAVLLLRAIGVPARLVSGFRGGDWNEYGDYLTVRQRHAHTWIEVYFPSYGWQRFDPTPPDNSAADYRELRFASLRKMVEYVELRWYKYIIDYDLQAQLGFARNVLKKSSQSIDNVQNIGRGSDIIRNFLNSLRNSDGSTSSTRSFFILFALLAVVAVFLILFVLYRLLRWVLGRGQNADDPRSRYYLEFVAIMKQKGIEARIDDTAKDFGSKVVRIYPGLEPDTEFIVDTYYEGRFGSKPLPMNKRKRIEAILKRARDLEKRKAS